MAIFWLLAGLFMLAGDAVGIWGLSKMHGTVVDYIMMGVSMLFSIALVYGATVEGTTLAYLILAMAVYRVIFGVYSLVTKQWIIGGVTLAVGLLFAYWGMQRLNAATVMTSYGTMMGGRRRRR